MKRGSGVSESGMGRRRFLKSTAAGAGAAMTLSGCGRKEEALIPLLVPEDRIVPGVDKWTASTCTLCPAGCGTLVRTMAGEISVLKDGQPMRQMALEVKKVEGNPRSPVNRGRLCARGQAAPQITYHPDRIKTPLRLDGPRGSGRYRSISWDDAVALLKERLAAAGPGLAAICGPVSHARRQVVKEFLAAAGSVRCYFEEPPGFPTMREANRRMFGRPELELHDFENAHYVVSFGANVLEAHTSPVRYNLALTHLRQGRPGERGKFVQVESRFSMTAANADEWLPARPGTEGNVALAMAHVILTEGLFDKTLASQQTRGFDQYRSRVLKEHSPESAAGKADIPAERIVRVAREFAGHRPSLALSGGTAIAHPHGLFSALAVHSLNVLVGGVGKRGGILWNATSLRDTPNVTASRPWAEEFAADADSIPALILLDSDPVYSTPAALGLRQTLGRIPFVAAFATVLDDSSSCADIVLPDQTPLERWDVIQPETTAGSRILTMTQPVIRPLYESRDSAEVLLSLGGAACGKGCDSSVAADFRQYLISHVQKAGVKHGSFASEDPDDFWDKFRAEGVWIDAADAPPVPAADLTSVLNTQPPAEEPAGAAEYPFFLQPFAQVSLGMGREADLPWMQELPDPMTSVVWGSWVEMSPTSAAKLGIRDGEWVWLESTAGRIRVPVLLQASARPDTLSMPFGQGHGTYGRYAGGRGANVRRLLVPAQVGEAGETAWAATRVRVTRTGEMAPLIRLGYDRERTSSEVHR